ncbi:MAG TPA: hypothetical protein VHZ56_03835, partial [Devosia sp.]|nr:hypothetical protein [Devosia sp.]
AGNRAICLPAFGRSEVSSWLPRKDWAGLQRVLPTYMNDILTLRQLLANCASPTQRQALNVGDLNRVIGVDIQAGKPILYML